MTKFLNRLQDLLDITRAVDFLGPLAIRLYLVPTFWMAGKLKLENMEGTIDWFGNPDYGLGLPFPFVMAWAATLAEVLGAIALLFGVALRWMCIPMLITMAVAAYTVHWDNGWLAISEKSGFFATERTITAVNQLDEFKDWLQKEHPDRYKTVTENGKLGIINSGIEFAATYFIMLLMLFFVGAGRYVSVDYWIALFCRKKSIIKST